MAAPAASLRLILEQIADTGESPETTYDETWTIAGFEEVVDQRILLSASASDQAVTITGALAVLVFSVDNPFKLRIKTGETLLADLRAFLIWCDDEDTAALATNILLSGNGSNQSRLRFFKIEKPA